MKHIEKISIFFILLFSVIFLTPIYSNAATNVYDEATLIAAVNEAENGAVIVLENDIALTKPLEIKEKTITINGNGKTITKHSDNWEAQGSNGSLITAGMAGTKVTLMNLTLKNSQKYGVQSYYGAYVVLDNVTIADCSYGGVLVNAGTVEIKNLTLNKNGKDTNNGIEIAKGDSLVGTDTHPTLIMNGTLSSTETKNVIYIAENDTTLTEFHVENTPTSPYKIFLSGNKVVITDQNNQILYESNENTRVTIDGQTYEAPAPVPPAVTETTPIKDTTPKTGVVDYAGLAILILLASNIAFITLKRKEH